MSKSGNYIEMEPKEVVERLLKNKKEFHKSFKSAKRDYFKYET